MNPKTKYIIEALRLQPLSEEEKSARHILGRLYGPIATCLEKTRNGRGYNKELWEKALADEIFKEKVANKSLFLELGHPVDREETDMQKVCACIPELPQIVDGDLYAYVDILDTPNGKLLKTLCDYGFVPGISSRGSGDVMENNEVDPDTFFLETWDIVQLPAVKKARLAMCESLTRDNVKLNKALHESYNTADDIGKAAIRQACENLGLEVFDADEGKEITEDMSDTELDANIKKFTDEFKKNNGGKEPTIKDYAASLKTESCVVDEGKKNCYKGGTPKDINDIPFAPEDKALTEEDEETETVEVADIDTDNTLVDSSEEVPEDFEGQMDYLAKDEQEAIDGYEKVLDKVEDEHVAAELEKIEVEERAHKHFLEIVKDNPEAEYVEPLESEEAIDADEEPEEAADTDEESEANDEDLTEAVDDDAEEVTDEVLDVADADITVQTMVDQLKEYDPDLMLEFDTIKIDDKKYAIAEMSFDDSVDGKLLIELTCNSADEDIEEEEAEEPEEIEPEDEEAAEESAEDAGEDEEVIESLKDLVRQNGLLENTNKGLKNKLAVSDALVKELQESLEKYKEGFVRTSKIAAENPKLKKQVNELTEQVNQQTTIITNLNESLKQVNTAANKANDQKVTQLTEALSTAQTNAENTQKELQAKLVAYRKRLKEQADIAESYKNKCKAIFEHYISSKAAMLGVKPAEITSKLAENYTLEDVDDVCTQLLESSMPTFGLSRGASVKVSGTSQKKRGYIDPDNGYDIDDSLLELAGLK